MRSTMSRRIVGALLVALALAGAPAPAEDAGRGEAVRRDLEDRRFKEALRAVDAWLAEPALPEADLALALALRAQAHAALGRMAAVEKDYTSLLEIRPGYEPDRSLTPPKVLARFDALRNTLVGWIALRLKPGGAALTVDGRPAVLDAGGRLALGAGEHVLRAEQRGHDPAEARVAVVPGATSDVEMILIPNSRTVVIRTEPAGVSVRMDGEPVGETARPPGAPGETGELALFDLPLGEHVYELSKPCFRTARIDDLLTVDLVDRTPKEIGPIALPPARGRVALRGMPGQAEVRVDGADLGAPSEAPLDLCAGERLVEVIRAGRRIWVERVVLEEGEERTLQVEPRPNGAWIGPKPAEGSDPMSGFSRLVRLDPPAGVDLASVAAWAGLGLPPDVDLAVHPLEREIGGGAWLVYSPHLGSVERLEVLPPLESPRWQRNTAGLRLADSELYGSARVVGVVPAAGVQAACALPGDRVLAVAATEVSTAAGARAAIAALPPGIAFDLRVESPSGAQRRVACAGRASPLLETPGPEPGTAAVRAAWAAATAAAGNEGEGTSALANLALALSAAGRHEAAESLLRRPGWGDRGGVGEGTRLYLLARELEALGQVDAAKEAYLGARRTEATAEDDEGPEVGPAAAAHLAELGVSLEEEGGAGE